MKFLTIALAALFSKVSGHEFEPRRVDYKFDPVQDSRAKQYYRDLVRTQVTHFNEAEQTQLILGEVGAICTAFENFYVFDFKKFQTDLYRADGAESSSGQWVHKYDGATKSDKDSSANGLLYRICGSTSKPSGRFTPKKEKLDPKTQKELVTDYTECDSMASNDKTKGNMYLVQDGKCTQSFFNGKFSAKIEDLKEGQTKPKQTWTLEYTSRQKCTKAAAEENFVVQYQGTCDYEKETAEVKTTEMEDCKLVISYTGKNACYANHFPLDKYKQMVAPFFGAIFIVAGLVMCFHGSKFLPYVIAFLMGMLICFFIFMLGYNFLNPEEAELWHFIVLVLIAMVFGIVASIAAYKFAEKLGIPVLSFWLGIMLALTILKLAQVQDQKISLVSAAFGGVMGVIFGFRFNDCVKQTGTAVIGSFIMIRGASLYIGNYPSEIETNTTEILDQKGVMLYYTIGYTFAFILFACLGTIYQRRKYPGEKEDNLMENEDESRICGLF